MRPETAAFRKKATRIPDQGAFGSIALDDGDSREARMSLSVKNPQHLDSREPGALVLTTVGFRLAADVRSQTGQPSRLAVTSESKNNHRAARHGLA